MIIVVPIGLALIGLVLYFTNRIPDTATSNE